MEALRTYRYLHNQKKLKFFTVQHYETDLNIGVDHGSFSEKMKHVALQKIVSLRKEILSYNQFVDPNFLLSFHPLKEEKNAPEIIQLLINSSCKAQIGPMAAVAGSFSELIAKELIQNFDLKEIIVENGGDIHIQCNTEKLLALYAGKSVFSNKLGIKIPASKKGIGVATSSGTVGHSFSKGKADALTVVCKSAALADAYATSFANRIQNTSDIELVINETKEIDEILGIFIIKNDAIGCSGNIKIVALQKAKA